MKPIMFAEIWNSIWPHKPLSDMALRLVWGPEIRDADDAKAVDFLRKWAREHTWPPSLHEFLVGIGVIEPVKAAATPEMTYTCEFCGEPLIGYQRFSQHLDEQHKDQQADPEAVKAIIQNWKGKHPKPEPPEAPAADIAESGGAKTGSDPPESSSATNGNQEPVAPAEPEPAGEPDHAAAWELASRNLRDHDGAKIKASANRSCTQCDNFAPGLVFRVAPMSVPEANVIAGATVLCANCWGCSSLGRKNHFGMPEVSQANRKSVAWKRFSNMVGTKGMRKKERATWINAALGATRRVLEARAKAGNPIQPAEPDRPPCDRCGESGNASRLLFGAENGGPIMAARCNGCGGGALYAHSMGPELPALEIASGDHWKRYDEVFDPKFDRIQMVAAAVRRTRKAMLAKTTPAPAQDPDGMGDPAPSGPQEAPQGAPEVALDDELPI